MMLTALLMSLALSAPAQTKPAPPPTLTGKWTVTLEMQTGTASPTIELVQDGEKITGTYVSARYGKFPIAGTLKGRALQFTFTLNAEGEEMQMAFKGEVAVDFQSIKGEANMGGAGEANWYAKRAPAEKAPGL